MTGNPGSGGSGGSGGQPVAAGPQPCSLGDLRLGLGAPSGAAGSVYYPLDFTNTGSSACTMYGYPGVALAATDGGPAVGAIAVRAPGAAKVLITLAPGASAHATLQVEQTASYPEPVCKPVRTQWLAVYPPASYVAGYLAFRATACTGRIPSGSTLGINVVRPGASRS